MSCHILEVGKDASTICTEHGRHIANCAMIFQEEAKQLAQKLESEKQEVANLAAMLKEVQRQREVANLQIGSIRKAWEDYDASRIPLGDFLYAIGGIFAKKRNDLPKEGDFCMSCDCPLDGFSEHHPSCEFRPRKA